MMYIKTLYDVSKKDKLSKINDERLIFIDTPYNRPD